MRLKRPIAFILSAAVAASALTGCDSFSGHAAAAANSAQVQQLIEFIADLGLERDLRQALQKGGDLRQALLTLLGLENAVNFNVDDLAGARPGQHAVQVWEVTAQSAEDAAALAASQIRAVLEQLRSNGVTEGRIGMVEIDGKYYVVVDVEVTEENTFEPVKPVSDDDDDSEDDTIPGVTEDANGLLTIDVAELELDQNTGITAESIIDAINKKAGTGTNYDISSIKVLDLSGCKNLQNIDSSAFENCTSLTSIDLRNTQVKTIGSGAFRGCTKLGTVLLPAGLESIGLEAFTSSGLTEINLSGCISLTTIDSSAFANCKSLTSINLSGCTKLESIGQSAFYNCSGLKEINLNGCTKLTTISVGVFQGCTGLGTVLLPESLTTIDNSAFLGCTILTSIDLRNTQVNTIDNGAFSGCTKLGTVLLPESLTTIGNWAFDGCTDLQSIYFQSDPTIGTDAFKGVNAEKLTVYYPSSWGSDSSSPLNDLKERLRGGGLDINEVENYPAFRPDTDLTTLTYLLSL